MEKFCRIFLSFFVCFFLFSCSDFQQDLASTTVEITPEFISKVRSATSDSDSKFYISVCMEFEDGSIRDEKKIYIAEETLANGQIIVFDNLPIDKKGTISIYVINNTSESESNTGFYADRLSVYEGEMGFIVKAGGQHLKIDVNPSTEYEAYFTTFTETPNGITSDPPVITFTESSIITAPLPVGTTRWQICFNILGKISYHGSFGEKIDVKKELMNYETYFNYPGDGETTYVNLEGTGESPENIKTPIVYCETTTTNEVGPTYTYKILGSETSFLTITAEITDYCFDNAGNFFFTTSDGVFKIAYNHKEKEYEEFNEQNYFIGISNAQLTYDKAQNYLYVYGLNEDTNTYLTRIQNPAGAIYKNTIVGVPESFWTEEDPLEREFNDIADPSFTVHDGILYVSKIQNAPDDSGTKYSYSLVLQKGSIESDTFGDPIEYEILSDAQNGLSGTTDIMFQDGSLYIIFSCSNNNWDSTSENYSTGGIVKYDTESGQFDESFGIKGFAQIKTLTGSEGATLNFYAPTSGNNGTESKYFYGPKQFVAIMPKKLVFLDSGADVSSYDASLYPNNPSKIPSKSRIVEYDLSTNSFSSAEITGTDLGFGFSGFTM